MAKLDFPVATADGQVWTGTNGVIYTYVGTPPNGYWQGITGEYAQDSNANIHVGDTPPPDPEPGNLWWDSSNDSGRLYMFYEDVDSSQWVEASPSGTGEDGEDSEPTLWDKNGNDLEPKVATDNVVIGGDKITLNATNGSGSFAGEINADSNIRTNGFVQSKGANALDGCWSGELNGAVTSNILADGRAEFAGNVKIGGTLPSAPNITLNANGQASFAAGKISIDKHGSNDSYSVNNTSSDATEGHTSFGTWDPVNSVYTNRLNHNGTAQFLSWSALTDAPGINITEDASISLKLSSSDINVGSGALRLYSGLITEAESLKLQIEANGSINLGGLVRSDPNITLNQDGSATFAAGRYTIASNGALNIYGDPAVTKLENFSSIGNTGRLVLSRNDSTQASFEITPSTLAPGTSTVYIFSDGTASFAGTVTADNVTFNLEADDDTKYTATTNEDGEQTLVYNGAVLDVKALLLTLQTAASRIESLETTKASLEARLTALEGAN